MKHLKNLKQYTPEIPSLGLDVTYLRDENGNDWYEHQKEYSADTIKVAYDANGIICAFSHDVSMLWPFNLSVIEFSEEDTPKKLSNTGEWMFDGKNIIPRQFSQTELEKQAQQDKDQLMVLATKVIAPLQDAKELGIATEEELTKLKAWVIFRIQTNRIEVSAAPNITWPTYPNI
ncbi:tail fiber assembly protein [Serratia quinivorans]|uniref:tail fiber assembly protein n=1 Tax=Serratia quinivorans TaxID=137545 RepID=UPI00217B26B6|nr:tail fiber assembly protein [Serratia quinivorans]CAI1133486.1 Caudovirales tail fibre assembly protein [Serratia quinivorans]CAI1912233.1 Caudovirales tail fibre assembly protein [Serratia quinivorans]